MKIFYMSIKEQKYALSVLMIRNTGKQERIFPKKILI